MPESIKKINQWVAVVLAVIAILASIGNYGAMRARSAVTEDTVRRHEMLLNENNLPVIVVNQQNIADDVSEMKDDLKALADSWNEYMRSH